MVVNFKFMLDSNGFSDLYEVTLFSLASIILCMFSFHE
jgi:hypothetical protein